jgi:biopolymer transport protein ExbD
VNQASWNFGEPAFDQLFERKAEQEMPEFDITAMVDLVFMMNIYFLVTFIMVSSGSLNLPAAAHCLALDSDTAAIVTVVRSLDGKSVTVYLGDGEKGEAIKDPADQAQRIHAYVEAGQAAGKNAVLLKAERKVRLGDLFRITSAVAVEGMKLHVAVMEKDES